MRKPGYCLVTNFQILPANKIGDIQITAEIPS